MANSQSASAQAISIYIYDLQLTPETDENFVSEDHTVTATLISPITEGPVQGKTISFVVTGANPIIGTGVTDANPIIGTVVTDANGQATFTYTGLNEGQHTVNATYLEQLFFCDLLFYCALRHFIKERIPQQRIGQCS